MKAFGICITLLLVVILVLSFNGGDTITTYGLKKVGKYPILLMESLSPKLVLQN